MGLGRWASRGCPLVSFSAPLLLFLEGLCFFSPHLYSVTLEGFIIPFLEACLLAVLAYYAIQNPCVGQERMIWASIHDAK